MLIMILKMTGVTALYVALTAAMWFWTKDKKLSVLKKFAVGIVFGISSVLSTHFGVSYEHMIINVRDIGPLAAGLFFAPSSGVIAGLIGGIERYIAGTYFNVSSYTRIACSVSTCLAGFVALVMRQKIFKGKKPSPFYAFFMGSVMEVFHMYAVFITHRNDMRMAFMVVRTCAIPMIVFTGAGMAISAILLQNLTGEWTNPFKKQKEEEISLSQKFQKWLFIITSIVILGSFIFTFLLQSQSAYQNGKATLKNNFDTIRKNYLAGDEKLGADSTVVYVIVSADGEILIGENQGKILSKEEYIGLRNIIGETKQFTFLDEKYLVYADVIDGNKILLTAISDSEVYWYRDAEAYEIAFADILLFTVIYVLIAHLVNQIVVNNIQLINKSLGKITNGNLNEVVTVRSTSEFASLSDDINQTVVALKGYIEAAEKRIEQELLLAQTIQVSVLPQNFTFPDHKEFNLFASMKPAKEVGGDFYDFFFVDRDKIALVIADVSGKGIPAAMFMMRSKTAIRSFAKAGGTPEEILIKANAALCEGNDAEMFVTAWIGILDLTTGLMQCANAGHEYPVLMHAGSKYELIKDKHSLALAAMPSTKPKPYEIQLQPGDRLFVYTDGIPEAINEETKQYGTDRMIETLNCTLDKSIVETLPFVADDINTFKGETDQFDDITMLGFEFLYPCGATGTREKAVNSSEQIPHDTEVAGAPDTRPTKTLTVGAAVEKLPQVMEFIESSLEEVGCGKKAQTQIEVSVEELFVNIANYAYTGAAGAGEKSTGTATITFDFASETRTVTISLIDSGVPYNPLAKTDPDITLSAEERQVGGLGIFMVKKNMDKVLYDFADGKNITTIEKII